MTLEEANLSLKLECALRELGFVEIGWTTYAHAGIFLVAPVSHLEDAHPYDDLLGFQCLRNTCAVPQPILRLGQPIRDTAKAALNFALIHSS